MPTPRKYFAIAACQNKIYCMGGAVGVGMDDEKSQFMYYITSPVNEVYDTVTGTWVARAPMPNSEMDISAHAVNGKIYVISGAGTYVYDPENDSWTTKTRMPPPYTDSLLISAVLDNKIIVTGEFLTGSPARPEQKILIYDAETDNWSVGSSGPTVVVVGAAGATTGVNAPKRVYILGLSGEQYPPPPVNQVYNPTTDAWTTATGMPTSRGHFGVVVVNDTLYAIGGYLYPSGTATNLNEQYTPFGYGTVPPAPTLSPEPESETKTFPTTLVATASGVSGAIIGVGLLVYFKKRRH